MLHGQVGEQRQDHEARHLRKVGDRGDERPAGDKPAVQRAVDAEIEGGGEVHAA